MFSRLSGSRSRVLLAAEYKGPKRRFSVRVSIMGGVVLTLLLYLLWQVGVPPHLPFLGERPPTEVSAGESSSAP